MKHSFIKDIWHNKSLLRSLMNREVARHSLGGRVVDIGGGVQPEYLQLFAKSSPVEVSSIDLKVLVQGRPINLETDTLPQVTATIDIVLAFNILEHIYNYRHVVSEMFRILKPEGVLYGSVPFLINYHPDPHDFFRYTTEALEKIFWEAGFSSIEIKNLGGGPMLVNYNTIVLSIPRVLRLILLPLYLVMDKIFLWLRPQARKRYPLGLFFIVRK